MDVEINTRTQAELQRLSDARHDMEEFKKFALERFIVYAQIAQNLDVNGVIDQGGGYITFKVEDSKLFNDAESYYNVSRTDGSDQFSNGLAVIYKVPKSFLFDVTEEEKEHAQYLVLRKKFENV